MVLNPWLAGSLGLLVIWLVLYLARANLRKEMIWTSIFTTPLGLTEFLFVPEYWNPSSLFNLAATTGFDIESFIFSFAIGGLGAVVYEALVETKHKKMSKREMHSKRHRFHLLALTSPVFAFLILHFLTNWNPIYSASAAMFVGGIAAIQCRPDLKKKVLFGGVTFMALYFFFFLIFNLIYPNFVSEVWNFSSISGILLVGIPIEELMFAFTFGMLWSSLYEHFNWYKVVKR